VRKSQTSGWCLPKDLVFAPRAMKQQANALSEAWVERYLHLKQAEKA